MASLAATCRRTKADHIQGLAAANKGPYPDMTSRNPYYQGPLSDHFDGTRFLNPAGEPETDRSFGDVLKWRRAAVDNRWPASVDVVPVVPDDRVDGLRVTMVGHATLLIQIGGLNMLTDPVWSDRASPFAFAGPKRVTSPGIELEKLPPIDAVLLSHNHYGDRRLGRSAGYCARSVRAYRARAALVVARASRSPHGAVGWLHDRGGGDARLFRR